MNHLHQAHDRVTLLLRDAQGNAWPLSMSAHCAQFVGRYRRLRDFGCADGLLDYAPAERR